MYLYNSTVPGTVIGLLEIACDTLAAVDRQERRLAGEKHFYLSKKSVFRGIDSINFFDSFFMVEGPDRAPQIRKEARETTVFAKER